MHATLTREKLTPSSKRLLDLMRKILYGRIENLLFRNGEPVFDPSPTLIRTLHFSSTAENSPRKTAGDDFVLKEKMSALFEELRRRKEGLIRKLEVRAGLPFALELEETLA